MIPSLNTDRLLAARRRLGVALGISAALHVAAAALWMGFGRAPAPQQSFEPLVITEYLTSVPPPEALPPIEIVPDPPEVFDEVENTGAASGGGTTVPDNTPDPADGASAPVQQSTEARGAERLAQSRVTRQPNRALRPAAQAAPLPPPPGGPSSGPPPIGVAGGTGTAAGGASAGSGPGTGGGAGNGAGGPGGGGSSGTGRFVERPERSPRIDRVALPSYPDEARRAGVGARARVRVLVDDAGEVTDVEIVERTLVERRGRERSVTTLPFGMEEAIAEAAQRTSFRAARDSGDPVRAYATITLRVGTDG